MDAFAWEVVGSVAGVVAAAAAIIALIPVLRGRKQVPQTPSTAGGEALPADGGKDGPVVVGEIPQKPLGFQPRADLLASLDAPGARSRVVVVLAVTGMRGVGKTHLAAAYARTKVAESWRLVAWINAEDLGGILGGLADVAASLDLGATQQDVEVAGRAVRHWLETGGDRCLLVFDNASDPELLQPFIPVAGGAQVIITSNQRAVANLGAGVPVDVFSEAEALAFLAGQTGSADLQGARAVAVELGYLPLALAQAAAVIADQHLGYSTYLDRLRSMPVAELLAPVEAGQYPRGVAAAVLLSLEGVRARDDTGVCTAVMALLAVLSPAGVRRTLVREAARQGRLGRDGQAGELALKVVDKALGRLAGASLLTFNVDGSRVSAHRLVTRVIREEQARKNFLAAVCTMAAQLLDEVKEQLELTWHKNRGDVRDLVEQIMALCESSAACPPDLTLVRRILPLRFWAVRSLNRLGDSAAQSIQVAELLLTDEERVMGTDHPETLAARNELAQAYLGAGRTAKAIILFKQTLADRERVLGTDHPETLRMRSILGAAYRKVGRPDKAITLLELTVADRKRVLGADDRETLASRNNLGVAYRVGGRTAEAITLLELTVADRERVLGTDHPDTLATRKHLALAYQDAGRTDEAITLLEQTLAADERVMGTNDPETLRMRSILGAAYRKVGRTAEAITLLEQTLADEERVLGTDHPDTLATRKHLALAYLDAGRTAEAITLLEQTLADEERVLGTDHPDTLATRKHLAAYRPGGPHSESNRTGVF